MSRQTKNLTAVLPAIAAPLLIEERPIPAPDAGQILVQNHAIAVNPIDWKRRDWGFAISSYPTVLGSGRNDHAVGSRSSLTYSSRRQWHCRSCWSWCDVFSRGRSRYRLCRRVLVGKDGKRRFPDVHNRPCCNSCKDP